MPKQSIQTRSFRAGNLAIIATLAFLGAVYPLAHASPANPPTPATALGPVGAPVSILVFSDYACPYSGQLFFQLESLQKRYPTQIRIVLKQDPLPIHPGSSLAHEAALAAAAQGEFASMSELLFGNQDRLDRDSLLTYAVQLHLDLPKFRRAVDAHLYRPVVEEDILESRAVGIDSTPTLFLNGHRLDGFQSLAILDRTVSAEVANAQPNPTLVSSPAPEDSADTALSPAVFAELTRSPALARGPKSAPVTIVEFSDFQCPFCRKSVQPLEDLLAQHPQQVRLIFRSFPLDFHQYSELAHEAAYAAQAQGKFWQMHDLIFANQSHLERADLLRYAAQLQLDIPAFERDLDAHTYAGAIAADRALGSRFQVDGTPTLFINGQRITGARSLVELEQLVDRQERASRLPELQQAQTTSPQSSPAAPNAVPDTDLRVLGADTAPIRVTWFADLRSPLSQAEASILRDLDKAYPGQLRIQFKTLQLPSHADSELASRALLSAAAQQKFWPMYDWLAGQSLSSSPLDRASSILAAAALGLDTAKFQTAIDDAATTEAIERDQAEEYRRSIVGSPVVFIAGTRIDGLQPFRIYRSAIDSALAAAKHLQPQAAIAAR